MVDKIEAIAEMFRGSKTLKGLLSRASEDTIEKSSSLVKRQFERKKISD